MEGLGAFALGALDRSTVSFEFGICTRSASLEEQIRTY